MTSKHLKTLKAIFHNPMKSSIIWDDIEALFIALGAERFEWNGSRVRFLLNGIKATFHRPRPQKETDKCAVKSVRHFLQEGGVRRPLERIVKWLYANDSHLRQPYANNPATLTH